ncbi:MAG TPA: hypothetical protein VNN77_01440, partial [candidate division Zixibacteria bacterium]|nr:hypothetical protein [candidate division Zixibacteria bacterium]
MRSLERAVNRWGTAARRAVLIVVVVHSLWPGAGRTQEVPQPGIEEEFIKQERIYRSRGRDVPGSYVTDRGLSDYAELLPGGFCGALRGLRSADRWLDVGAGTGQAILDYYAPADPAAPAQNCVRPGERARAVAISIEDRRTEEWRRQAARLGDDRIRYLYGKRLSRYSSEELGKFQIVTDVYGGFTYTTSLSRFVEKVLSLLEIGGAFYTLVPGVHLENGENRLGKWLLTEVVDPASRPVKVCGWLRETGCVKVACESKSDWDWP